MSQRVMSAIHRIVIVGAILSGIAVWLAIRGMSDVNTGHAILYTLFPGVSLALALYCPCMVISCLGRR